MKCRETITRFGALRVLRVFGVLGGHQLPSWACVFVVSFLHCLFVSFSAQAQAPVIGGNVYGGGNQGYVGGSTTVQVKSGNLNKVFGGARMANVGGYAYVNIDGQHATDYTVINYVFGGNDISGTIGTAEAVDETLPMELVSNPDGVDITWNTYVHLSTKTESEAVYYTQEECDAYNDENGLSLGDDGYRTTSDIKTPAVVPQKTYIGQLFAGGNGDYYYNQTVEGDKTTHYIYEKEGDATPIATKVTDNSDTGFNPPEVGKAYLDIQGGSIVYAYGGGNKATVTKETIIHMDNPSDVVNSITDANYVTEENTTGELLTDERFRESMGINMAFSQPGSDEFQIGRLFGGNNLAAMDIMPKWNLQSGLVRNLYSGGNKGVMTSSKGLLLEINPNPANTFPLKIDNVYGGCRMADVMPTVNGIYTPCTNLQDKDESGKLIYNFPNELSARVLVRGGDINNVYGGNDITGRVYGGNAVGIYTSIRGDVYGGGNGAYPYTDNIKLKDHESYGDLFYDVEGGRSVESLTDFRPNAEQVSVRLAGTSAANPTVIGGAVYVGGNCATLKPVKEKPLIELKMGSYVIADKVFLGNNGEGMVTYNEELTDASGVTQREGVLRTLRSSVEVDGVDQPLSQIDLTDSEEFATYMEGVAMDRLPSLVFDRAPRDPATYIDYSSYIGSLFCGGNIGSMTYEGTNAISFSQKLIVYDKLVGGCNNANVPQTAFNAAYKGGIRGTAEEQEETDGKTAFEGKDRLVMNINGLKIQPLRLYSTQYVAVASATTLTAGKSYYTSDAGAGKFTSNGTEVADGTNYFEKTSNLLPELEWNTAKWKKASDGFIEIGTANTADDDDRRLIGGNIFGGCYNSGHVNGNVVINISEDVIDRYGEFGVFADVTDEDSYVMKPGGQRRSGVILDRQGDDVMPISMTVFGGGCGEDTEIWGSTTINHNNGYAFQIFGGGEQGVIGKKNTSGAYGYDAAYSTTVNLSGQYAGYSEEEEGDPLAESEYLYGAGNKGTVCGNSYLNLGNGRVYDAIGGATNADILGATEVHIGRQPNAYGGYKDGFPWIRDNVYGGNDFGGTIRGKKDHSDVTSRTLSDADVMESATFVRYIQGRVDSIFGGNYGYYDYGDEMYKDYTYYKEETGIPTGLLPGDVRAGAGFSLPHLNHKSLVYFQPVENDKNVVKFIFGGSAGVADYVRMNNSMQEESYVFIDDTETTDETRYAQTDIYGGGSYAGMGNSTSEGYGSGRTMVDLYAGRFHNVYGGSDKEGLIGYTRINVPVSSTIKVNALFGGGKGYDEARVAGEPELAARFCDNYVTCIDYKGANAIVEDAIYGGNQNSRIACDTYINIEAPVMQSSGYQATIYGGGYGSATVSGRTNIFMNSGSNAYKVFGGGRDGNVFNYASLASWLNGQYVLAGSADVASDLRNYRTFLDNFKTYIDANPITLPSNIGTYVNETTKLYDGTYTNDILPDHDDDFLRTTYNNTNVHIMQGGNVSGYAYGGGYGTNAVTSGITYLELLGGNVDKDIYGGGQGGPVIDYYGLGSSYFTATTNVYIEGGMARNVYGGGYLGDVGKHTGDISASFADDILAEANVTIGKKDGTSFLDGIPAIMRNAYGGGEGGSVFGTANITLNNGYIGYRYKNTGTSESPVYQYVEELDDQSANAIEAAGNVYGGGYVVNSYVDEANVTMYDGIVRGSLYGGGELGSIGVGTTEPDAFETGKENGEVRIFRAGKTLVKMYDGHVKRNVFGGGRGQDSWGGDGTKYMDEEVVESLKANGLFCKGYVFGQTEVNVYGGEIGTSEGVARGYGNVFGGGDIGFVYSAYKQGDNLYIGKKNGKRYDGLDSSEGYYYRHNGTSFVDDAGTVLGGGEEKFLTEDCKVLIEPWCKVTAADGVDIDTPNESGVLVSKHYNQNKYVPTAALNTLSNKDDETDKVKWAALSTGPSKAEQNKDGILIHNAVFAGGNTSPGSTVVYVATTTVYGNATASIHDVFHRDLITVGTGRTGGLYGDGNLTTVDGYRELNITNYGTDYYSIKREITYEQYEALPNREAAYYEIRYRCLTRCTDKDGKTYLQGSTITADELRTVFADCQVDSREQVIEDGEPKFVDGYPVTTVIYENGKPKKEDMLSSTTKEPNPLYWEQNGVCSRYAGRIMNTIQRADFCGVFGSRMVMQGAQDRVPTTVDYTNYTINRVREVSLNKKESVRSADLSIPEDNQEYDRRRMHGNYFGIYSIVNFLGSLTSDVDFHHVRKTNSDNENNNPDLNPAETTITANATAQAELAAHPITGVTVSGSTVTVSDVHYTAEEASTFNTTHSLSSTDVGYKTTDDIKTSAVELLYKLRSISGIEVTGTPLADQTYYNWKAIHHEEKNRNNGTSHNKVALASGVYLELTTEKSTGDGLYEKDWGYITGVVELDLISVQQGLGGGFVYAKNEHGIRQPSGNTHTILTALNEGAITNKLYKYEADDFNKEEWETSGNFVHSSQTIIDDCYNVGGRYLGSGAMPAHYWYIKGLVYVYDQYISAYTGAPNAYSEIVNIPLTITSASHGRMTLLNVMPNRYAYYTDFTMSSKLSPTGEIVLRDVSYKLNDPISYWDYFMLSADEKKMFVDKTYVTTDSCKIGDEIYPAGYVMLPAEYADLYDDAETRDITPDDKISNPVKAVLLTTKDKDGRDVEYKDDEGREVYKAFDDIFRESNNVRHNTGYILTYKVDNPGQWDTWYTPKDGNSLTGKKNSKEMEEGVKAETISKGDYEDGPTYTPTTTGLYGQQDYRVGNIISEDIYNTYQSIKTNSSTSSVIPATGQAKFERAYIVTVDVLPAVNYAGTEQRFYKNATLGKSAYVDTKNSEDESDWDDDKSRWSDISGSVAPAYVVTSTIQLNSTDYIYRGTYMTEAEKTAFYNKYKDGTEEQKKIAAAISANIVPAYYCLEAGKYGGNYFETGHNYRGLAAFSSMSDTDRANFTFNYDAFDVLIDPDYSRAEGVKYQYDGAAYDDEDDVTNITTGNKAQYSIKTSIDYTATYKGSSPITYKADNGISTTTDERDELTNTEYESLLNECYYYAPINVKKAVVGGDGEDKDNKVPYYVINKDMFVGDTPYAPGQVIDNTTYESMSDGAKLNITTLTFPSTGTYYFCREAYKVDAAGTEVTNASGVAATVFDGEDDVVVTKTGTYASSSTVPAGFVIDGGTYDLLKNDQANFVIHGLAPTETSTLYVPSGSDIKDVSTEKIITVVYQYDYVETDMGGRSITPVSERHVLNIHLQFKSGVPTIEDIHKPEIILPGTTVSIKEPFVTPGAYEVTGGGWELFDDETDAESHINGIEYSPNINPLYLYQNKYLVAYYARTYLGKTYSNAVPVSVANYHDLKKVMDAKEHHYYIDHEDIFNELKVEPKIYINDYSGSSENGLDLFKDLYDLSVLSSPELDSEGLIDGGTFDGHKPLNERVKSGNHLEFFLRTDIAHPDAWAPVAGEKLDDEYVNCFQGTFHGDGHTLSGLNQSFIGSLCGKVYNLGVTGSFSSAGVADSGEGYVENCWVNTTGSPDGTAYAVFGNPTRGEEYAPIQIVNSYCQEGKTYKTSPVTHGVATPKPQKAFYDGEVAYDLNGFYLYKRYCDEQVKTGTTGQSYQNFIIDSEDKPVLQPLKYYASNPEFCSSGYRPLTSSEDYKAPMYVEDRYADGDFRYADGSIPSSADERYLEWKTTYKDPVTLEDREKDENGFFPIWPDDYIFFGQMLTYGYGTKTHQDVPTAVVRSDGRLSQTADANRVYRAPAYYGNSTMSVVHFNPNAYLAQESADGTQEVYPHMTAIDFAGHNDVHGDDETKRDYEMGDGSSGFYPPLLDDDGLLSIRNCDETRNLLVYAPSIADNAKTYTVLNGYFKEPKFNDHYTDPEGYRLVGEASPTAIYGHLVQNDSHLTAAKDHLLVDKQDFNCPISYCFAPGQRIWYQRSPETHVDRTTGWDAVSLPFTADLVTTNQKGEITHFYGGSNKTSDNTKVGHEYWLRTFKGIQENDSPAEAVANFECPDATSSSADDKVVTNKFLWDYYYSQSSSKDANTDFYQQYYKKNRLYEKYPRLAAATPYLIGFPGSTYYEFDLSGSFVPEHTYSAISGLEKQIITFASAESAADKPTIIRISDDEMAGVEKTLTGTKKYTFTFKPNYLTTTLTTTDSYTLNDDGDKYEQVETEVKVLPFRPYFTATAAVVSPVKEYKNTYRSIVFTREPAQMYEEGDEIGEIGELVIRAKQGKIVVTSTLKEPKNVSVVSVGGAVIDRYTIQPGETVETSVNASGIYIVNKKKLSVKI